MTAPRRRAMTRTCVEGSCSIRSMGERVPAICRLLKTWVCHKPKSLLVTPRDSARNHCTVQGPNPFSDNTLTRHLLLQHPSHSLRSKHDILEPHLHHCRCMSSLARIPIRHHRAPRWCGSNYRPKTFPTRFLYLPKLRSSIRSVHPFVPTTPAAKSIHFAVLLSSSWLHAL